MRVTGLGPGLPRAGSKKGFRSKADWKDRLDLDRCTRCGEAWGFEIVEQVEIWTCSRCGYEARVRSGDLPRMVEAEQQSIRG